MDKSTFPLFMFCAGAFMFFSVPAKSKIFSPKNKQVYTATHSAFSYHAQIMDTVIDTIPEFINIPNIFTPNGDGINDVMIISTSGVSTFDFRIYNRDGQEVFYSNSPNIPWDGRTNAGVKVSDGTYYYVLKATSLSGKDMSAKGFITIVGSGNGSNGQ